MADDLTAALASLQGIAQQAAQPERVEPGPGDVGPTTQTKMKGGLVTLPMSEDALSEWWLEVERARQRVRNREGTWDILLREYLPNVSRSGNGEDAKVQAHFRNVHSKIGQLFYRSPDLIMSPKDPSPAQNMIPNPMPPQPGMPPPPPLKMEDVISIKQTVLQDKLGRDGIKASRLMDELLFDVLAWAGIGCCKIGYKCVTKSIPVAPALPALGGAPPTGAVGGSAPALGPVGAAPMMPPQMQDVPIYEDYYCRRFSPKKVLWNSDLHSTRFEEDSTWKGMEFFMSPKRAMLPPERGGFGLTEDEVNKAAEDDRLYKFEEDSGTTTAPGLVHGVEIWCKASYFTDEVHPLAYCQLVLLEGIKDRPIVWRPSPDQSFDERGQLTKDSLVGNPIQILTIRDLADSPYTPSDSAFTNNEIKQLSTSRRQSIAIRDAAVGKYCYDSDAFGEPGAKEWVENGQIGSSFGLPAGKMAQGLDKVIATTAQVHRTPDDYRLEQNIKQDIQETLGISAVEAGSLNDKVHSATEIADVRASSNARNDKELSRVVDFYLDIARMLDQLLMRYATQMEYVEITGIEGAKTMYLWNGQMISGRYLYDIAPDSQLRVDTAKDFQLTLNFYNIAAADPLFNRAYVLRRLARMRGFDPAKIVLSGLPQLLQPPHGGQGQPVNSHEMGKSGGTPNAPGASNHRDQQSPTAPPSGPGPTNPGKPSVM